MKGGEDWERVRCCSEGVLVLGWKEENDITKRRNNKMGWIIRKVYSMGL